MGNQLCKCGCGKLPTCKGGFIKGHWNKKVCEVFCACGCGAKLTRKQDTRGSKYVRWHANKLRTSIPWKEKLPHGDTHRMKLKVNRDYMSKKLKGRGFSLEWRKKMRLARQHQKPSRKDTSIELLMCAAARERGLLFETNYSVIGQPDLAWPDYKLAVFCDGDYWHAHPNKYPNKKQIMIGTRTVADIRNRDNEVNSKLKQQGWTVLRFWESDINTNVNDCVDLIERTLVEQVEENRGVKYEHTK